MQRDGTLLAVSIASGSDAILDAQTLQEVYRLDMPAESRDRASYGAGVSADGRLIIGNLHRVTIWDFRESIEVGSLRTMGRANKLRQRKDHSHPQQQQRGHCGPQPAVVPGCSRSGWLSRWLQGRRVRHPGLLAGIHAA